MSEQPVSTSAGARVFVGIIASALIVGLGIYNAASPVREGLLDDALTVGSSLTVPGLNASEPAAKAGLRPGDRILYYKMPRSDQLNSVYPRSGVPVRLLVERGGKERQITIVPDQLRYFTWGRYVDLGLEIGFCIVACLVLVRARRGPIADALAGYILAFAASFAAPDSFLSMPSVQLATAYGIFLSAVAWGTTTWFIFRLIGLYPPEPSRARRLAGTFAPVAGLVAALWILTGTRLFMPEWLFLPVTTIVGWVYIAISFVGIGFLVWSAVTVSEVHRARMRWFASTLIVFHFFSVAIQSNVILAWFPILSTSPVAPIIYYGANLAPVGPIYATLRHRLVDLDFAISRSAVYGLISLFLVAVFVGLEWIAKTFTDAFAGQVLGFLIAIASGVSIRRIHALTEKQVNDLFFRARMKRLASLKRFALEADLVNNPHALLNLTYEAMIQSVESPAVAVYILDGDAYACLHSSDPAVPERLDQNNRVILRMMRWPEPFTVDERPLHDWLLVPLLMRTRLIGFLGCGPKVDQTSYAPDEVEALRTVAHHVATSYAFLAGPELTAAV